MPGIQCHYIVQKINQYGVILLVLNSHTLTHTHTHSHTLTNKEMHAHPFCNFISETDGRTKLGRRSSSSLKGPKKSRIKQTLKKENQTQAALLLMVCYLNYVEIRHVFEHRSAFKFSKFLFWIHSLFQASPPSAMNPPRCIVCPSNRRSTDHLLLQLGFPSKKADLRKERAG